MSKMLSKFGISIQIGFIGALGMIGLILVGIFYFIGSRELAAASAEADQANASLITLASVQIDLLQMRRAEKDLLLRHKEEPITQHKEASARFGRDAQALRGMLSVAREAQMTTVLAAMDQYQQSFTAVVADVRKIGFDENSGLQGALRGSVHDIEQLIDGDHEPRLAAAMLMMRRHEKDFLARLDRKYIDEMKQAAFRFAEVLSQSDLTAELKAQIGAKLAAYQRDFMAAAEASLEQVNSVVKLSKTYADAEPGVVELVRLLTEEATREKVAAEATAWRTTRMIGVVIASLAAIVAVLAWLIGRSIAGPLKDMARLMDQLANGDVTIAIGHSGRRDEVGTLARSLEIFKSIKLDALQKVEFEERQQQEQAAKARRQEEIDQLVGFFGRSTAGVFKALAGATADMARTSTSLEQSAGETDKQSQLVMTEVGHTSATVQTVSGRDPGTVRLDRGDRPPGERILAASPAGRWRRPRMSSTRSRSCAPPPSRSARWSSSSTASPARPICWR